MPHESHLSFSVSVVCFDSTDSELQTLLSSLLDSIVELRRRTELNAVAVFLIDNSERQSLSLDIFSAMRAQLDSSLVELRLIQGHGNIGYGAGHNLVLPKLASGYHLILNPDVRMNSDCLACGVDYMENNSEVAIASPFAEYASGDKQHLCKRYPSVLTFLIRGFFPAALKRLFSKRLASYEMHDLPEDRPSTNIPIVSGCFMLCRSEALLQAKGFDEDYFLYFEDFDLSLRLSQSASLAYVPAMRIQHDGGNAARKGGAHLKMFAKSGLRFFTTHGWRFFSQAS